MFPEASLVLEDGSVHRGYAFGAIEEGVGEVVFNTTMTGYQEVLTDPSYAGQLVTLTYPLVGNYGINEEDSESRQIQVAGLVVREHCDLPSHGRSSRTLHQFLESQGIPGISGVDTRAVTRRLRTHGVLMGTITTGAPDQALERLARAPRYDDHDFVSTVTTKTGYDWNQTGWDQTGWDEARWGRTRGNSSEVGRRIVVTDCGLKYNILRQLSRRGCQVTVAPATATAEELLALQPAGVLLSPGPGDPRLLDYMVDNARELLGRVPVMGICLGHQIIARALGAETFKLKYGHRGGNHPVKDLTDGRVYITAQNHGYAVDAQSLPSGLEISHINLNDGTVEGLRHSSIPVFSIQYHSEAAPGPNDSEYLFDHLLQMVDQFWK